MMIYLATRSAVAQPVVRAYRAGSRNAYGRKAHATGAGRLGVGVDDGILEGTGVPGVRVGGTPAAGQRAW